MIESSRYTTKYAWRYYAAWMLLVLMAMYCVVRGPYRQSQGQTNDFSMLYTGSATWLAGHNPYKNSSLTATFAAKGGEHWPGYTQITIPSLFVVMSPVGLLSWRAARWVWLGINSAAMIAMVLLMVRAVRIDWRNPGHVCATALLIGLAPFQTSFAMGQICIICGLLVVLAWLADRRERPWIAGICLALAIAFKPTMAGLFLIYWLAKRRWRPAMTCMLASVLILAIGGGWMMIHHLAWYTDWQQNLKVFGGGDPTQFSILIGLDFGLGRFLNNRNTIQILTLLISGIPLLILVGLVRKEKNEIDEYRHLALVGCISLLVVYHRFYDAVLLVFLWAWAVQMIRAGRRLGWVGIALLLPFLANGTAVIYVFSQNGTIPAWLQQNVLWQVLVIAHLTWVLVIAMIILTLASIREVVVARHPALTDD